MGINYTYYILAKNPLKGKPISRVFETTMGFDMQDSTAIWQIDSAQIKYNTKSTNHYFQFDQEWGPSYETALHFLPHPNFIVDISLDLRSNDSIAQTLQGMLVLEITNGADTQWSGVDVQQQTVADTSWQRVYISSRFAHEKFYKKMLEYKIKTYFWNREKQAVQLDNFKISFRPGNPILYGDTNEFIP
jgi:hypothetical protein